MAAAPPAAPEPRRCGFVALVGAPNAGKSSLVNRLVGSKVAIVTAKAQTTRSRTVGIAVRGRAQMVLVDTPGIFAPRRRLDRAMVAAAWAGARDADLVVHIVDAARMPAPAVAAADRRVIDGLREAGRRAHLALNKIDLSDRPRLLVAAEALDREALYDRVFMISALDGDGVDDLAAFLAGAVPEGPWLYPEDQVADMPLRLLAAETTREKLFLELHQELPYALTVETERWTEQRDGAVRVEQVVYVERESQKAIVLGRGGRRIKRVGELARREFEAVAGQRIHLFLFVKVRRQWADDPARYREMGLEFAR